MPLPSLYAARTGPPQSKIDLLPVEILSEIFLLVLEDQPLNDYEQLMKVCRRWYAVILSTPGIPAILWIEKSTTMESTRSVLQGKRWLLRVVIGYEDEELQQYFNYYTFDACFMATLEAASRWRSLFLHSFPRTGKSKTFQIVEPLKGLETFSMSRDCDLGSFFEPLLTAIATTATPRLTEMELHNLNAILYLVQPACLHIFCYLTNLSIILPKSRETPINILPHLQRLEKFRAQHLHLPIYPPDASLPLIQTLHSLDLTSVSVQWMAGKVFPVLRKCRIKFPHHIGVIRPQPVAMPACTSLRYTSNDLSPLRYFRHLPLAKLKVTSGQYYVRRGNRQLMAICPLVIASAEGLTELHLYVRCSEQLLTCMLRLVPTLKVLELGLDSPHALSETFFQAFIIIRPDVDRACKMVAPLSQPLCVDLTRLHLHYKRWLRGPERKTLIPIFSDIRASRLPKKSCKLLLSFDDEFWNITRPLERIDGGLLDGVHIIGIPSPHGIILLESFLYIPLMEVPFKEAEYLWARYDLSIDCLPTLHHLVELRIKKELLFAAPLPNLPLFHTLRVLEARNIHPLFLSGQTFHKLERCSIALRGEGPKLSQGQVTQMPVCTRLDVGDLSLLATFNLPQVCELSVSFDHPEAIMIWEKPIAVSANLSGLELLHVRGWHQQADLIQALRCLRSLKHLIIGHGSDLHAGFFREFVPMYVSSHYEGHISLLCPTLRRFWIEGFDPTEQRELMPVLKEVVILRAVSGSPLEMFTFYDLALGRMIELIGSHGNFVVKEDEYYEGPFDLEI